MKLKLSLALAVLLSAGAIRQAGAITLNVGVNDRPYYLHGPAYYVGRTHYVWAPGHWARRHHHRRWVHGSYVIR